MRKRKRVPPEIRFWAKVNKGGPDDCWLFIAKSEWGEYKGFWNGTKFGGAHRFSLELKLKRKLEKGECALHTCDNKHCVNPNHLWVGSNMDNSRDMVKKGRKEKGADVYGAKLTDKKVRKIRKQYAKGKTPREIAPKYGICPDNVLCIVSGKTWKHVGGPIGTRRRGAQKGNTNAKKRKLIRIRLS